jgi:exopolyphosphatase/guanosine-5'-triphosphate,3'-diphosphate pyrophosphatase
MRRRALIDIGSNTVKILIAEISHSGQRKILDQASLPCRLIPDFNQKKTNIPSESQTRLIACINKFKKLIIKWQVDDVRVVGTEAFRKAENSDHVIQSILEETSFRIEILSGNEEAQAVAEGLLNDPNLCDWKSFIALDLGGGSLELLTCKDRKTIELKSLPLGAIALAGRSGLDLAKPIPPETTLRLRKEVDQCLEEQAKVFKNSRLHLAGCGGTLVFLRQIIEESLQPLHPEEICFSGAAEIYNNIASLSLQERIVHFPKLPADRADIFPYGLLVLLSTMQFLGKDLLVHSFYNLRHGLVFNQSHQETTTQLRTK